VKPITEPIGENPAGFAGRLGKDNTVYPATREGAIEWLRVQFRRDWPTGPGLVDAPPKMQSGTALGYAREVYQQYPAIPDPQHELVVDLVFEILNLVECRWSEDEVVATAIDLVRLIDVHRAAV
jgi:hypothetical protein